jgi:hypothetical protein
LGRRQLASRTPQILLQLREVIGELLAVFRQLVSLLEPCGILLLIRSPRLPGHAPNAIRLGVLFLAQAVGFARQGIELAGGLLLLRAAH